MPQVASCAQGPRCCQWLSRGFENNLISEIHFLALATSLLQSRLGRDGCLCSQRKQGRSQRRRCPHQSCTFSTCSVPEQKHLSNSFFNTMFFLKPQEPCSKQSQSECRHRSCQPDRQLVTRSISKSSASNDFVIKTNEQLTHRAFNIMIFSSPCLHEVVLQFQSRTVSALLFLLLSLQGCCQAGKEPS